jgi:hemerythrin superfamily protein
MDVLSLLKRDHDDIRNLFEKFDKAGSGLHQKRWELFEHMRLELQIHSKAEEEIFYPALKALNEEGRKLVSEAVKEHKEIDDLILQIGRIRPADEKFADKVEALMEDVEHHVEEEEGQIFQFAKENCPPEQLRELAVEIEKRKMALQRQWAA